MNGKELPFPPGDWSEALEYIDAYFEYSLGLESAQDKAVWSYIVSAAVHLEYVSALILWNASGRLLGFDAYERMLTLAQAASDLETKRLLDDRTITVLRDVAVLRNGMAHRHAYRQAADQRGLRRSDLGVYRGRHVFNDLTGLIRLMEDVQHAAVRMFAWLIENGEDEPPAERSEN